MLHTLGLKTDREFFDYKGEPYEFIGLSHSNGSELVVVRCLVGGESLKIVPDEVFNNEFKRISQADIFTYIDNDNDDEHSAMMQTLGVGYICPFCGGRLAWESDFMCSEVNGLYGGYVKIEDDGLIRFATETVENNPNSGICGVTDDIEAVNLEVDRTGEYRYMYMREDKKDADGNTTSTWWVINDPVIGIYRCMNCGKSYEVMDCPPSEENEYPYFY